MQTTSATNWLGRLSVAQKLALLPLVLVMTTVGILAYTISHLNDFKDNAQTIHLISRVRVLNEMYLNRAITAGTAVAAADNGEAKTLMELMTSTLQSLRDGGAIKAFLGSNVTVNTTAAPTDEIRGELSNGLSKAQDISKIGDQLRLINRDDPSFPGLVLALEKGVSQFDNALIDTVKRYTDYSEAKIQTMMTLEILAIVVFAIISFGVSTLISRQVARPLNEVVKMAIEISAGNLRQNKLTISTSDEIGKLGEVFNVMLDNLCDLAGQNLSVSKNLGSSAAEVLASIQEQAAATKQQAASVQQTTTTMEEINQSGAQISERAKQVIVLAEDAASSGRVGLDAVQNTNQTMNAIREQVEAVAEKIVTLSERTQAVGEIISTVNDIAEQSNLLALNAAIEAAAAGEHGRSFTVVANEMKNLADQAKESTVRVRSILGDIQTGINSSVMLTEEAVKRVESGKQQAEVAERTIMQMSGTSKESTSAFHQIVGATSQQQIGFEQITIALKSITTGAEQTAASTNQLEKAALNLNAVGQQLQKSVERYRI